MVVCGFPQCDGYGRCRCSWPAYCHAIPDLVYISSAWKLYHHAYHKNTWWETLRCTLCVSFAGLDLCCCDFALLHVQIPWPIGIMQILRVWQSGFVGCMHDAHLAGVQEWLFWCFHGLSRSIHFGRWWKCMRWCLASGLIGIMNLVRRLLAQSWDSGLWCHSSSLCRWVWTSCTWWQEANLCRNSILWSARASAIWNLTHPFGLWYLALCISSSPNSPISTQFLGSPWLQPSCHSGENYVLKW